MSKSKFSASKREDFIHLFLHSIHPDFLQLTRNHIQNEAIFSSQVAEYPERALLLANKDDWVILNHRPNQDFLNYLADLNLGTKNILIPNSSATNLTEKVLMDQTLLDFLKTLEIIKLHPYFNTPLEVKLAQIIQVEIEAPSTNLSQRINHKTFLPAFLNNLNIPIPNYEIADSNHVIEIANKWLQQHQKIIIRGDDSYGGLAAWAIQDHNSFEHFKVELKTNHNQLFLIEKLYKTTCSPNIQYHIHTNHLQEIGITDQMIDSQLTYHGNIYPSLTRQFEKINHYSQRICQNLQKQAYKGLIGIDFIETTDKQLFVVDINGRPNTSSFGLNVIRKIFPSSYDKKHVKILTHHFESSLNFTELIQLLGKHLFNDETKQGILPYNTGFLPWGKLNAIVIADSPTTLQQLLKHLTKLL